ncbi:MAG: HipA family kinase [Marinomonas sp.]
MENEMEQVQVGVMLPGSKLFNDHNNINPTYKSHVKTHEGVIQAYVKLVSHREIYIECVCGVIGRFLGLPIPKPLIVKVDHEALPTIEHGKSLLAFGSEDSVYPSLKRRGLDDDIVKKLKDFTQTLDVGVFDEWIGNPDRHGGNILFDGSNQFTFIDHGLSISESLTPDIPASKNIIVEMFFTGKSEFEKYKTNREAQSTITPLYPEIPLSLLSEKTYATSYLKSDEVVSVINFLEERSKKLNALFEKRLDLKQQGLAI